MANRKESYRCFYRVIPASVQGNLLALCNYSLFSSSSVTLSRLQSHCLSRFTILMILLFWLVLIRLNKLTLSNSILIPVRTIFTFPFLFLISVLLHTKPRFPNNPTCLPAVLRITLSSANRRTVLRFFPVPHQAFCCAVLYEILLQRIRNVIYALKLYLL